MWLHRVTQTTLAEEPRHIVVHAYQTLQRTAWTLVSTQCLQYLRNPAKITLYITFKTKKFAEILQRLVNRLHVEYDR